MAYTVLVMPSAARSLERLPGSVFARLDACIKSLSSNPRPFGVKKLAGKGNTYRVRVGNYRILYEINDSELTVLVTRIGHRGDVYD